jgi:hypothetical protein
MTRTHIAALLLRMRRAGIVHIIRLGQCNRYDQGGRTVYVQKRLMSTR